MRKHHRITKQEIPLENTFNIKKSIGIRVISKNGLVLGKVLEIRMNPKKLCLEGIIVSRGIIKKPFYIGKSYIQNFTQNSAILNIDPVFLFKGRKVIDPIGRKIGTVKEIIRNDTSNELKEIKVKSFLRKELTIPTSQIKSFGKSIILKPSHNVKRKYFWQNS